MRKKGGLKVQGKASSLSDVLGVGRAERIMRYILLTLRYMSSEKKGDSVLQERRDKMHDVK